MNPLARIGPPTRWEKEVSRLSVRELELVFDMESGGLKKKDLSKKSNRN
jgi:hypothetical protein